MADPEVRFRRDATTWLCYAGVAGVLGFEIGLGAAMPVLREELGVGLTVASLHFTALALAGTISAAFAARLAGALGRRLLFQLSVLVCGLACVATVAGSSAATSIAGVALFGVGGALLVISAQAELIQRHGVNAAVAMAEINIASSLAMIGSTLITGPLAASPLTWRSALALPVVALIALQIRWRRAPFSGGRLARAARPSPVRMDRTLRLLSAAVLCQTGFEWTVGFWGAEYLAESTALSAESAASAMTLFFGGMLAGRLLGRALARRVSPATMLVGSFVVPLAGFPVLALAPSLPVQLAGLAMCGLGIGNAYPMIAVEAGRAARGAVDAVLGRLTVIASASIAAAPFLIGALGDAAGIERAFWLLPPLLVLGAGVGLALARAGSDAPATRAGVT